LHGLGCQIAVCIEPVALAHGFFEVLVSVELSMFDAANFQAETVGAQVDGSQALDLMHFLLEVLFWLAA
jgi:hypothetical protein